MRHERRVELRPGGEDEQDRNAGKPIDEAPEQLERGWVRPLGVFEQDHRRSAARARLHEFDQDAHRLFFGELGRNDDRTVALLVGDRQQGRDKAHVLPGQAKSVDDEHLDPVQARLGIHLAAQRQRPFKRRPNGIKGAVDEKRRALEQLGEGRLVPQALAQVAYDPALTDTGFAAQQDRAPCPGLQDLAPAFDRHREVALAPDQRRETMQGGRFEPAFRLADAKHLKDPGPAADTLELLLSHVLILKFTACQPAHAVADDDGTRLGDGLQTGCEIERFAHRIAFAGSDDHHARGDADADLQPSRALEPQPSHRVHDVEPGTDGPFRLAFVRERKSEKSDDAVAQRSEDVAFVTINAGRAGVQIGADDDLKRFRIVLVGELGKSNEVAEQHRQLATFADRLTEMTTEVRQTLERLLVVQHIKYSLSRTERQHQLLEIAVGQDAKGGQIDFVSLEDFVEPFEAVRLEPFRNRRDFHDGAPPALLSTKMPWLTSQPAIAIPEVNGIRCDQDCAICKGVLPGVNPCSSGATSRPPRKTSGLARRGCCKAEAMLMKSPRRHGVGTNLSSPDSSTGVVISARASMAGSGAGSGAAAETERFCQNG